jgi:RHS repeat-associated protein
MKSIVHGPALDELILQDVNPFEDLVHGIPLAGPTLSNATGNITLVSLGGVLGDPASTRVWFIQDSQNSVIAITNSTGFVLEGYEYHPYGDPVIYTPGPNGVIDWGADDIIAATSSYSVVNLYTGREWDHESGLYHYRSRYMSPMMGRFISSDTIGVWGDPNNLGNGYAYVGNGPFDGSDSSGSRRSGRATYQEQQSIQQYRFLRNWREPDWDAKHWDQNGPDQQAAWAYRYDYMDYPGSNPVISSPEDLAEFISNPDNHGQIYYRKVSDWNGQKKCYKFFKCGPKYNWDRINEAKDIFYASRSSFVGGVVAEISNGNDPTVQVAAILGQPAMGTPRCGGDIYIWGLERNA